ISWILAIIFLTFTVRGIMFKPFVNQIRSMKKMQEFAPELKKVQKKYANDKQRQAQEMQKLQREHGVNPLGSCLPMLLQVPVMIAASLLTHLTARHSAARQNMNPETLTPQTAMMQKLTMYIFPLGVLVFGGAFPIGLLVYWLANNSWTLMQQRVVYTKIDKEEEAKKQEAKEKRDALAPKPGAKPKPGQKPAQQQKTTAEPEAETKPASNGKGNSKAGSPH